MGTDPIPVSFALRDRKITPRRSMPDDVSGYVYFHGRVCALSPSPLRGGILYEQSVNPILRGYDQVSSALR